MNGWSDWVSGEDQEPENLGDKMYESLSEEDKASVNELTDAEPVAPEFRDIKINGEDLKVLEENAGKLNFLNRIILSESMKPGLGEAGLYLGYLVAFAFNLGKRSHETE